MPDPLTVGIWAGIGAVLIGGGAAAGYIIGKRDKNKDGGKSEPPAGLGHPGNISEPKPPEGEDF